MVKLRMVLAACAALLGPPLATAEVKAKAPDGFAIQIRTEVALDRDDAWARLVDIGAWWNGEHTYSGDAGRLSLDAQAGGCWCELWGGGEIEHGRVVLVMPRELIRFETALGPLQEMGVSGAMTLSLESAAGGKTAVTLNYKVSGSSLSGLDAIAPIVDGVLAEAMSRYAAVTK